METVTLKGVNTLPIQINSFVKKKKNVKGYNECVVEHN